MDEFRAQEASSVVVEDGLPDCWVGPETALFSLTHLSRLETPLPYPVGFWRIIFCLVVRMGDFLLTELDSGEWSVFSILLLSQNHAGP